MIILYKNAARVNFFVDVKVHCMGGFKQDVQGTSKVVPYNCASPDVPCSAKLRELNDDGMIGKEIDAELCIRGDRGEISWKKQDTLFMLPSVACTLEVQVCTKERSETIKKPFCLCFSSGGIIIGKSEPICILSKPPNIHRLPFARIVEGKSSHSSPSRWIQGYSPETHTYIPLNPVEDIKVWKIHQDVACASATSWDELNEENTRLKKRLKTMETERQGLVEALRLLKPINIE
jgi:hypothetical protein